MARGRKTFIWLLRRQIADRLRHLARAHTALQDDTRAIVVNTPHNPTGFCIDAPSMHRLVAICRAHNLILFCDEVYRYAIHACALARPPPPRRARTAPSSSRHNSRLTTNVSTAAVQRPGTRSAGRAPGGMRPLRKGREPWCHVQGVWPRTIDRGAFLRSLGRFRLPDAMMSFSILPALPPGRPASALAGLRRRAARSAPPWRSTKTT